MEGKKMQYVFGAVLLGIAVFQIVKKDYIEMALYLVAGSAFVVNALTMDERMVRYKKPLTILSWILIAASGIMFLYFIQFRYL